MFKLNNWAEKSFWLPLDVHMRRHLGSQVISFGYPKGCFVQRGIDIKGNVGTPTTIHDSDVGDIEVLSLEGLRLENVNGGYSGAPVFDCRTQKVIGHVYAKCDPMQAFCVPIDRICQTWPADLLRVHDVYKHIREHLGIEARVELEKRLNGNLFIPLNLEAGVLPKQEERRTSQNDETRARGDHGRRWAAFDTKAQLLPPRGCFILSSDVGAGKTTFLCWLATELAKAADRAAILMSFRELEERDAKTWAELKEGLVQTYNGKFLDADLDDFLESYYSAGKLVFLFDGLDQIKHSPQYSDLANRALRISHGTPCLLSSRPTAVLVYEERLDITFLRLNPLSVSDQKLYFGSDYLEAQRISTFAPDLVSIPILAFVVRTLIGDQRSKLIITRSEAYKEFLQYILQKHEPHLAQAREQPGLLRNILKSFEQLSYEALAADEPQIQRIDQDFYFQKVSPETRANLEDLPKFGLVNLILDTTESTLIYFTHLTMTCPSLADRDRGPVSVNIERLASSPGNAGPIQHSDPAIVNASPVFPGLCCGEVRHEEVVTRQRELPGFAPSYAMRCFFRCIIPSSHSRVLGSNGAVMERVP